MDRKFWQRMLWKWQDFMRGRTGLDALNKGLCAGYVGLVIVSWVIRIPLIYWLENVILIVVVVRALSRNIGKRQVESEKYERFMTLQKTRWKYRKDYKVFRCGNCGKIIRVPRHKGKIEVSCPNCRQKRLCKT